MVTNHNSIWTALISNCILHDAVISKLPDIKVHGANMGPAWGRQDTGGPHIGPVNFAIWAYAQ